MTWPSLLVVAAYFAALAVLALYGLHRLSLVWIYLRRGDRDSLDPTARDEALLAFAAAPPAPSETGTEISKSAWPVVTVQLPVYNERYVVERLIDAACALRYQDGRIEIQVLDDSTDATAELAARRVASYSALGHDIHHLRRDTREGYKAGALAAGLAAARGELIAVFDADFIPTPDFLERIVPRFLHEDRSHPRGRRLGMVQARWGHINRDHSLLTRAQALVLDGHFVVEHGARDAAGRFLNFNGTAGMFRRECIDEAGGWQPDTLTEDLDLSYRAQLAGWRFESMPDLVVPAELPVELNALRSQQRRWSQGSIQTARRLTRRILQAPLPRAVKLEALVHLTNNATYPLLAALAVLIVPALAARDGRHAVLLWLDLPLFLAGTGSFALYCAVSQRAIGPDWLRSLADIPVAMAMGIGLSFNNSLAVIEALLGTRGSRPEFLRTPKFRVGPPDAPVGVPWTSLAYRGPRSPLALLEGAFALWFAFAIAVALSRGSYMTLPFLLLFETGFLYVTAMTLAQALARAVRVWSGRRAAALEPWPLPGDAGPPRG